MDRYDPRGACPAFCCTTQVWASDGIQLRNEDRLSGTIISMEDTVLAVDTDYADLLKIDWKDYQRDDFRKTSIGAFS